MEDEEVLACWSTRAPGLVHMKVQPLWAERPWGMHAEAESLGT